MIFDVHNSFNSTLGYVIKQPSVAGVARLLILSYYYFFLSLSMVSRIEPLISRGWKTCQLQRIGVFKVRFRLRQWIGRISGPKPIQAQVFIDRHFKYNYYHFSIQELRDGGRTSNFKEVNTCQFYR